MEALARKRIEVVPSEQKWLHTPLEPGRACIYVGVCRVNNKMYVGQYVRKKDAHTQSCWEVRIYKKRYEKRCPAIYNAIQKHGFYSFDWYILAECAEAYADAGEKIFMQWCDCIRPNGYNIREGGSRGRLHADSVAKLRAKLLARPPHSAEHRKKISDTLKGVKLPSATRFKMSVAKKGMYVSAERIQKMKETKDAQRLARWATLCPTDLHKAKIIYNKNRKTRERRARELLLRSQQESV